MLQLARRAAAATVVLSVLGCVVALALELPAQFVSGTPATDVDLGAAVSQGTALSAPVVPLLVLLLGLWLTGRSGWPSVVGTVLLGLVGLVMTIGGFGEWSHGLPFTGVDTVVFVVFNVVGLSVTLTLLASALVSLLGRREPARAG